MNSKRYFSKGAAEFIIKHCLGRQQQVNQHGLTFDISVPKCTEQASQIVPTIGHFWFPTPSLYGRIRAKVSTFKQMYCSTISLQAEILH